METFLTSLTLVSSIPSYKPQIVQIKQKYCFQTPTWLDCVNPLLFFVVKFYKKLAVLLTGEWRSFSYWKQYWILVFPSLRSMLQSPACLEIMKLKWNSLTTITGYMSNRSWSPCSGVRRGRGREKKKKECAAMLLVTLCVQRWRTKWNRL